MKLLEIWDSKIFRQQIGNVADPYAKDSEYWDSVQKARNPNQPVEYHIDENNIDQYDRLYDWEDKYWGDDVYTFDEMFPEEHEIFMVIHVDINRRQHRPRTDFYFERGGKTYVADGNHRQVYVLEGIGKKEILEIYSEALGQSS